MLARKAKKTYQHGRCLAYHARSLTCAAKRVWKNINACPTQQRNLNEKV